MPIRVTCPCGKILQGKDEDAGRQARCPTCGTVLTLAAEDSADQPWPPATPDEEQAAELPLRMDAPSKPANRFNCHVCAGVFGVDDVYEDGGDYICKRCHERAPAKKARTSGSSRYSSSRRPSRYDDDDDDDSRRRPRRSREYVDNHMVWAILSMLFCCQPAGIVAVVYAAQVDSYLGRGDVEGARLASNNASTWCWVAVLGALIPYGLMFLWFFIACAGASAR